MDGKQYDLEMHIVHQFPNQTEYGVLGIFFDVEDGGNTENKFLSSLKLDIKNAYINRVDLQALINDVDMSTVYTY